MADADYYENAEFWGEARYTANPAEARRLGLTVEAVPSEASSLLDVGAGNGVFLGMLERSRGALRLTGVERARTAIGRSECRAPLLEGSADALPFEGDSFDVVSALEVIEHLPHGVYEAALAEMARVASRWVLISVPWRERRHFVECASCSCVFSPIYHLRSYREVADLADLVPGYALRETSFVTVDEYLGVAPVAQWVNRTLHRVGVRRFAWTVCPQCSNTAGAGAGVGASAAEVAAPPPPSSEPSGGAGPLGEARRWLRQRLPTRARPRWAIALYERV